jgi:molybdopterin converting factor small subunit
MNVRYIGSVRTTTGERQVQWEKPASTLRELLRGVAIHYGPRFKDFVLNRGNVPDEHIIVRVNGRDARYLDGADTPLGSGDTITLASMMRIRPAF